MATLSHIPCKYLHLTPVYLKTTGFALFLGLFNFVLKYIIAGSALMHWCYTMWSSVQTILTQVRAYLS